MAVSGIDLGKYKLGWHDSTDDYEYTPTKGLNEDIVKEISHRKSEPEWMTKFRLNALDALRAQADARVVRDEHARHRLRRHLLLPQAQQGRPGQRLGHAPGRHEGHLREAGHPRGRAQVPRRGHRTVRVGSRVPQEPRRPGAHRRALHEHGPSADRLPRSRARALRHDHPAGRQQVRRAQLRGVERRLVHLRAAGRARRHAAAGLLPHQRGERRPVRAHADHRRRGLVGALRGGMLGAGVLHRLVALRGGRADREAGCAHPLHHDPELVAQRVQPRHQARGRADRGHRRVDRRQPRLEAHDEVPGGGDDGPEGARRGAVGRVRGCRSAPGRRAPR